MCGIIYYVMCIKETFFLFGIQAYTLSTDYQIVDQQEVPVINAFFMRSSVFLVRHLDFSRRV